MTISACSLNSIEVAVSTCKVEICLYFTGLYFTGLYFTGGNLTQDSANFILTNLCLAGYRDLQLQADKIAHNLNKNIVLCQSTHLKKNQNNITFMR